MKIIPILLFNLTFLFNAFPQHQNQDVHTHLFDVHCSSCNTSLGKLSLVKNQNDSIQFLISKDAVVINDSEFHCKVCDHHLFDQSDASNFSPSKDYAFIKPTKKSVINLKLDDEQAINLKNFCPVCHQKVERKIHPKGYASANLKWKHVRKLFN